MRDRYIQGERERKRERERERKEEDINVEREANYVREEMLLAF